MKKQKLPTIKCPHCGYEYLAAEIYLPNRFFGKPESILRDDNNQILSFSGSTCDVEEQFDCWNCNTTFFVNARVNFIVAEHKSSNFDEEFTSTLHPDSVVLSED